MRLWITFLMHVELGGTTHCAHGAHSPTQYPHARYEDRYGVRTWPAELVAEAFAEVARACLAAAENAGPLGTREPASPWWPLCPFRPEKRETWGGCECACTDSRHALAS